MPPTEDERPVEALGPDRLDHPSGVGVRVESLDRGRMTRIPSERSTMSNGPLNFASRSRMRNRTGLLQPSSAMARFRACCVTHAESGVRGRGAHVDPPAAELNDHEDVERLETGRLHAEEVAGDDAVRLGSQELAPGRSGPSRGRTEPRSPQQGADRRRPDADPELAKLALDPDTAPAGALPGQPEDERTDLRIDRRPAQADRSGGTSTSCVRAGGASAGASTG
jgi:hypothetical protein